METLTAPTPRPRPPPPPQPPLHKVDKFERETYNEWDEQIRFHIGDSLYFKYHKDSVLEVRSEDYETLQRTVRPVEDHLSASWYRTYFIRLVSLRLLRLLPDGGGGHGGHNGHIGSSPAPSSTHLLLPVASCVVVSIVAVGVVLYQLMN
ncbi:hypothetical protein Droror1_Dr00012069 [Drosera rotundifolia]